MKNKPSLPWILSDASPEQRAEYKAKMDIYIKYERKLERRKALKSTTWKVIKTLLLLAAGALISKLIELLF